MTIYSFAASGRSARSHWRMRRCARVSPGAAASVRKSSGLSTSRAMPGNESTTQGLPVAWAAAWCGLKLSLPKRAGNRPAGLRKMALVPRPSAAGTSTEPSRRRGSDDFFEFPGLGSSGMSPGMTRVLRIPCDLAETGSRFDGVGFAAVGMVGNHSEVKLIERAEARRGRW